MDEHTATAAAMPLPPTGRERRSVLAAEGRGGYDLGDPTDGEAPAGSESPQAADGPAGAHDPVQAAGDAPFGLPVLGELPELAGMLGVLAAGDRLLVDAVVRLAGLLDTGEVESATGVAVEQWLGIVALQTRMDRRLLARLARLLHRLPTLGDAAAAGQISFAQLRGLAIACRDLPVSLDRQVDGYLADALPRLEGSDPDAVVTLVGRLLDELHPDELDHTQAAVQRRLYLQPWLDGTGGTLTGTLDSIGLAVLDEATARTPAQLRDPRANDRLRADNLIDHLLHTCPTLHHDTDDGGHDGSDPADRDHDVATAASEGDDHDTATADLDGDPDVDAEMLRVSRVREDGSVTPVQLQVRVELAALLDQAAIPADVLTRLCGGRLRLSADAARRLVDERGAQLRTIIIDQGTIVGVGRSRRQPPGWLAETIAMSHDTCTGPLCDRAARTSQLDHAIPWHPPRPDDQPGTTDIDNLAPLCATTNRDKEAAGWTAIQTSDGRRTWTHPRTGLTITSVPRTWRPPGHPAPHHRRHRHTTDPHDTGTDPPGDPPHSTGSGPPDDSTGGADPPDSNRPPEGTGSEPPTTDTVDDDPLPF